MEAVAPDGVIEAISTEVNGAPVLAVQWHPEWKARESPESQTSCWLCRPALRRGAAYFALMQAQFWTLSRDQSVITISPELRRLDVCASLPGASELR